MKRFLILILTLLTSCQSPESQHLAAQAKNITIKVGESGESFAKRYPELLNVNRQPAGVDFYRINFETNPRGTVTVEHGQYSFSIAKTIGLTGAIDHSFLSEGLVEFDIYSALTERGEELISHDATRLKTYDIVQEIMNAGWRPITSERNPRLTGQERLDYALNVSDLIGLEPTPIPTLEEWMKIEDRTMWHFYADHLYLDVYFKREPTREDPNKPRGYLLGFNIKSEAEHFKAYVAPRNRAKWKEILPISYAKLAPRRAKAEAELIAKGIKIDTDYQDPPLPDLK